MRRRGDGASGLTVTAAAGIVATVPVLIDADADARGRAAARQLVRELTAAGRNADARLPDGDIGEDAADRLKALVKRHDWDWLTGPGAVLNCPDCNPGAEPSAPNGCR